MTFDTQAVEVEPVSNSQFNNKRKKPRSKIRRYVIISVIILLLILGIVVIFLYPSEPDVKIKSIEWIKVKWNKQILRIKFIISIDNDNLLGATIEEVNGEVFFLEDNAEENKIGRFFISGPYEVAGDDITHVPLYFDLINLPDSIPPEVEIKIVGTVELSLWFIDFTIPIDKTETVPVDIVSILSPL